MFLPFEFVRKALLRYFQATKGSSWHLIMKADTYPHIVISRIFGLGFQL